MESPRNHRKPGTFSLIIAHDKTFLEMDIHLVNGCPCLTVTITIGVDHTDLACTMKFSAKKKGILIQLLVNGI